MIREHLDECAPCLRQYGIEQEVKALVARCCGSDRAPESLRVRIVTRIQQVRVELGHVEYRAGLAGASRSDRRRGPPPRVQACR